MVGNHIIYKFVTLFLYLTVLQKTGYKFEIHIDNYILASGRWHVDEA